ncbi:NAD(P)/FAD-dependent oxidoreductase [Rhodococcus sp. UNC363MFTsu5.1]|uniref:NAD(P)/FAD-dependent oxidoreductase n=1 Tax=Rhodococcus sp. UNC363MFTsu5.1 TaxID=1449069 RepID=UPI0004861D7A|nr:FAD-dependent oxidoreductase [Rhodococcus sp. UNC363MFTsu5.1]
MHTVLILGAGFGGLELAACLSESVADEARVVLVDQSDSFMFGFAKMDVLFKGATEDSVRIPYRDLVRPGVEFRRETVTSIDPRTRRVVTDRSEYEPDTLVVALGADYEPGATPGFVEDGHEYYSIDGVGRLRARLDDFTGGRVLLGILSVPFKCPPAPYEGALLLHDELVRRGLRDRTSIHVLSPMDSPIPVSAETSTALVEALAERGIEYSPGRLVHALDPSAHRAHTRAGDLDYDLFIGIPKHRVPDVVEASGLTEGGADGWVAVDQRTLATPFPGVYAIGDCADAPVPRAGVFAEDAARTVASVIAARARSTPQPEVKYPGRGACHIEFGGGLVGKVDADFLSGPAPVAPFIAPSAELATEKAELAAERRRRWFTG